MTGQPNKQANGLKEIVDQVKKDEVSTKTPPEETYLNEKTTKEAAEKEIDVLQLPPRKEVHHQKQKRVHIKISPPFVRLFIAILIVLIVLGGIYYGWDANMLNNSNLN